jgi:tetratricopeptide (TPR) repeat protein
MRASILGLSISVATVVAIAPAHADDKAKAKALYEQGLKSYNIAEYQDAIKAWKEAYSLSKKSILLFNIGQAYRLDGDCKKAMTFYDSYQREESNPKNQDELDSALALCAKGGDKPVDKPVVVDKKPPVGDKPVADKPVVDKPVTDKPVTDKPVTVAQGSEPAGEPEEPVDTPETTGGGLRKIGIGVGAAGVLVGGLAIYFALDSGKQADLNANYVGEWTDEQIAIEKHGKRSATAAWINGSISIAAIAAGTVMFVIGGPKATESSGVAVVPTRGGAAASWSFTF